MAKTNNNILVLRLEGPMQAWGEKSKWDTRDSATMPTKSGIVGLLSCAMGIERGDEKIKALYDAMTVAVRADRQGALAYDYQTITSNRIQTAEGGKRTGESTIVSKRAYLQDAAFTVFVSIAEEWIQPVVEGLKAPKWPLSLGRKAFVPSRPIFDALTNDYESLMAAVKNYPATSRADTKMVCEFEEPIEAFATYIRQDGLEDASRHFALRRVWRGVLEEEHNVFDKN